VGLASIDLVIITQDLNRIRIYCRSGLTPGAIGFESVIAGLFNEVLGKDAPGRITGAKEQYLLLWVCHGDPFFHIRLAEYKL